MDKAIEVLKEYLESIDKEVADEMEKSDIDMNKINYLTRTQMEIYKCISLLIANNGIHHVLR